MKTPRLIVLCAVVMLLPSIVGCVSGQKNLVLDRVPVAYVTDAYLVPANLPELLEAGDADAIMAGAVRVEGRYLIDKPTLSMLLKALAELRQLEAEGK